jgi:PBP1b-binding outer membrane lipoprotein LpoB
MKKVFLAIAVASFFVACNSAETTTTTETPKVETPVVETPKADSPVVETPKVDSPAVATPKVDSPAVKK